MNYQKKDTSVTQEECLSALSNKYPELKDWKGMNIPRL